MPKVLFPWLAHPLLEFYLHRVNVLTKSTGRAHALLYCDRVEAFFLAERQTDLNGLLGFRVVGVTDDSDEQRRVLYESAAQVVRGIDGVEMTVAYKHFPPNP